MRDSVFSASSCLVAILLMFLCCVCVCVCVYVTVAERAWSTAAAKKDALAKTGKRQLRQSELSRHSKAVKWARALESLCLSVPTCDPHTALEASAYASCMEGQLLLEREQWAPAVAALSKARAVYEELCHAGDSQQRDLFSERIATAVLPSLRFCKYNLSGGEQTGEDDDGDVALELANDPDLFAKLQHLRSKRRANSDLEEADSNVEDGSTGGLAMGRLKWCGRRVQVPSQALRPCLLEVETAFETLHSEQLGQPKTGVALESCLTALDDAAENVSEARAALLKGSSSAAGALSVSDAKVSLQHLQNYLQFRKLSCFSLRSLELVADASSVEAEGGSKWTHAQELSHLYKQLGLTCGEMITLVEATVAAVREEGGGSNAGDDEEGEEEDVISLRLRSEQTLYRVSRLVALADCYALAPVGQKSDGSPLDGCVQGDKVDMLGKATALLELADDLMSSSVYDGVDNFAQAANPSMQKEVALQQARVAELEKGISGAKLRYAAALVLHQTRDGSSTGGRGCLDFEGLGHTAHGNAVGSALQSKLNWLPAPASLNSTAISSSKDSKQKKNKIEFNNHGDGALCVCPIPPPFAPIPCKPVFYDVALNHLDLTTGDSEVARGVDRRCGLQVSVGPARGRAQSQEERDLSPGGSSSLVGAAAQSIYGWWSGGSA